MSKFADRRRPFTTIDDLIIKDTDLSWKAKISYVVLAQHSNNKTFTAFPSYKRIGELSGSSQSSAKRGIKELLDKGYIQKERRFKDNGSETSSLYYLIDLYNHPRNEELNKGCSNRTEGVSSQNKGGGLTDQRTRLNELDSKNKNNKRLELIRKLSDDYKNMLSVNMINPGHMDEIYKFIQKHDVDVQLVKKAMKKTKLANNPTMFYLMNKLESFVDKGITSVSDLEKEKSSDKKEKTTKDSGLVRWG